MFKNSNKNHQKLIKLINKSKSSSYKPETHISLKKTHKKIIK